MVGRLSVREDDQLPILEWRRRILLSDSVDGKIRLVADIVDDDQTVMVAVSQCFRAQPLNAPGQCGPGARSALCAQGCWRLTERRLNEVAVTTSEPF